MATYTKDIIQETLKKKKQAEQDYSSIPAKQTQTPQLPQHPQTAPAVASAIQAGADPKILNKAKSMLGNKDFIGLCEAFVEQATGMPQKFASAFADWNANKNKAIPLQQAKPGDKIFFAPDDTNGGYGHVALMSGSNSIIGATDNGVKQSNLSDWLSNTKQRILGVIPS